MNIKKFILSVKKFVTTFILIQFGFNSYAALNGTYTINGGSSASSTNYRTFASAVSDMSAGTRSDGGTSNGVGVSGPVTFVISNGTYNEQLTIGAITGASATNKITFRSYSGDSSRVVLAYTSSTSSTNNFTLYLNGADYLTFSKIAIKRTGTAAYANVIVITNNADNNTFTNCLITGKYGTGSTLTGTNALVSSNVGYNDINNTFFKNNMRCGTMAFYLNGASSSSAETGNTIKENIMDSQSVSGIYGGYLLSLKLTGNNITIRPTSSKQFYAYGIYLTGCKGGIKILNNKVNNQGYASNASGIYLKSNTANSDSNTVINNFVICSGKSAKMTGITLYNAATFYIYYNNLLITSAGSSTKVCEVLYTNGTGNEIINNVMVNLGGGYVFYYPSGSSNVIKYSQYNNLFTTGSYLAIFKRKKCSSLASWQSVSRLDANTKSVNPSYVSNSDLHVQNSVLNNVGKVISTVRTDFDGQLRSTTTPDIGADEFAPLSYDMGISSIDSPVYLKTGTNKVYIRFSNYGTSTITSAQLNWSVNGTLQSRVSWTGSVAGGNSSLPIQLGTITAVSKGTYRIKAWSTLPNGRTDDQVSNDTTTKTTKCSMSGSYTIGGTTPDYPDFSSAVDDLNIWGINGAVTFNARPGKYEENFSIGNITGSSSTNTITFQPETVDTNLVIISSPSQEEGSGENYVVQLDGTCNVTFDHINFERTGSEPEGRVIEILGRANANKIQYCTLTGVTATSISDNEVIYSGEAADTGNSFVRNYIYNGVVGISLSATPGEINESGTKLEGNVISNSYYAGILLYGQKNLICTNNQMNNNSSSSRVNTYGIRVLNSDDAIRISGNQVNLSGGSDSAVGILFNTCNGTSSRHTMVANNMVVTASNATVSNCGIQETNSSYIDYAFNSVLLRNATTSSICLNITSRSGSSNIECNNLVNRGGGLAFLLQNTISNRLERNNYYSTGTNLCSYSGRAYTNITDWRTATRKDAYAVSTNPKFISANDLHLINCILKNRAYSVTGITTDFDGNSRDAVPDIGADEMSSIAGMWTGMTSSSWSTTSNWCNDVVPTSLANVDVRICCISLNGATTYYPIIPTSTTVSARHVTIDSGAVFTVNGGELDFSGNFDNNGTFTTTGSLKLTGNGNQQVDGGSYYDLESNGTGIKTATDNITIRHALKLNRGILETPNSRLITLDSNATISENNSSYVRGRVQITRRLRTNVCDTFGGIGVELTTKTLTCGMTRIFRMTGDSAIQNGQTISGGLSSKSIKRYYDIFPTERTFSGILLSLRYLDCELNGLTESDLGLFCKPTGTSSWVFQKCSERNRDRNYLRTTEFDDHHCGRHTCGSSTTPLPVKLISFTAVQLDNASVQLDWKTASEINNDHFLVQRSFDGSLWENLESIPGFGTTSQEHSYQYIDKNLDRISATKLFYRLRQVDYNGDFEFSPIVALDLTGHSNENKITGWYSQNDLKAHVRLYRTEVEETSIKLVDANGKIISTQDVHLSLGSNSVLFDMSNLPLGIYHVIATSDKGMEHATILKR